MYGIDPRDLPDDAVRVDHRLARLDVGIHALVDEKFLRERIAARVEHLDRLRRRRVAFARTSSSARSRAFSCWVAANACDAAACSTDSCFSVAFSSASERSDVK